MIFMYRQQNNSQLSELQKAKELLIKEQRLALIMFSNGEFTI